MHYYNVNIMMLVAVHVLAILLCSMCSILAVSLRKSKKLANECKRLNEKLTNKRK